MAPPGRSHLSRAYRTDDTIDSRSRKYPIHSERITSTFSGSSSCSMRPRSTVTTSDKPCARTRASACVATPVASTANTRLAPAFAAQIESTPVPAPTSRTTLPLKCRAAFRRIAS